MERTLHFSLTERKISSFSFWDKFSGLNPVSPVVMENLLDPSDYTFSDAEPTPT
ncbi:MAG: hypothetical protein HYV66_00160 [Candidatus Sungbacteria bacterium]|uniref:Uncharacterized protein n=1 Tax=Candidatus Sungiibacteriota bacterium TaxID=2750080 RepID=A0A931YCY5_9BACT|nr:hypothetical protein [Candidatus Sungbacteria bacterium]